MLHFTPVFRVNFQIMENALVKRFDKYCMSVGRDQLPQSIPPIRSDTLATGMSGGGEGLGCGTRAHRQAGPAA